MILRESESDRKKGELRMKKKNTIIYELLLRSLLLITTIPLKETKKKNIKSKLKSNHAKNFNKNTLIYATGKFHC